jgi:outer membrane protein assembly factor BamB
MMNRCLLLAVAFFLAASARADNWPAWRGPHGDGRCDEKNVPLTWDNTDNVRWKVKLPAPGNSSPIVWGDRIFLTQALDKAGHRRAVMCLARKDGEVLWQKETAYKEDEPTHDTHPFCAATPVTDGERVIANLGSAGLVCYDFEGKEQWRYDLGKLRHLWGAAASSPILHGELCIVWCGPGPRQFLLAVDKKSGQKVWQHDEKGGQIGDNKKQDTWVGSWSTPIIVHIQDHDELILAAPERLKGFDPKQGKELWWCDGLSKLVYTTPLASADGIVVAMSGYGGPAIAVKAGGTGDVTAQRLSRQTKGIPQRIGSGVIVGDHAYLLNEDEQAVCFEVKTGKQIWKERLPGKSWSSMVLVEDRIYVPTQSGDCYVVRAAPKFQQLAVNPIGERVLASPAISDGEIFIRSYQHLWCIAEKK